VETVTAPPAVGVLPIDKPLSVMVTATLATTAPDCNEMTTLAAPLAADKAAASPLTATLQIWPAAKNAGG